MAKQTVKQRKALRSKAKPRRVRKNLGNGMSMLVTREEAAKPREMIANDLETPRLRWARMERVAFAKAAETWGIPDILRGTPPKPSLWQRIKGWFA